MKRDVKKFLRKMIKEGGFIADDLYGSTPVYWRNNSKISGSHMNMGLLSRLKFDRLIYLDGQGRYQVSEKGKAFARPWYRVW